MKIAVVTGASSGMGRAFALQLDQEYLYDEIWVIARREDRLRALKTRAKLRVLPMDLKNSVSFETYTALLDYAKPDIRTLVNASGYGNFEPFEQSAPEDVAGIIDLNCKALAMMTRLSLPYMHEGAQIINIGSLSAFQPVPYMISYASSKAMVLSFTRGLNVELKPRGIRAIAVCPGWVDTEFIGKAQARDKTAVTFFNKVFTAEDVVKKALKDLKNGKDVSVLGFGVRAQVLLVKLLPHRLVMKIWMHQQGHKD